MHPYTFAACIITASTFGAVHALVDFMFGNGLTMISLVYCVPRSMYIMKLLKMERQFYSNPTKRTGEQSK